MAKRYSFPALTVQSPPTIAAIFICDVIADKVHLQSFVRNIWIYNTFSRFYFIQDFWREA